MIWKRAKFEAVREGMKRSLVMDREGDGWWEPMRRLMWLEGVGGEREGFGIVEGRLRDWGFGEVGFSIDQRDLGGQRSS